MQPNKGLVLPSEMYIFVSIAIMNYPVQVGVSAIKSLCNRHSFVLSLLDVTLVPTNEGFQIRCAHDNIDFLMWQSHYKIPSNICFQNIPKRLMMSS